MPWLPRQNCVRIMGDAIAAALQSPAAVDGRLTTITVREKFAVFYACSVTTHWGELSESGYITLRDI